MKTVLKAIWNVLKSNPVMKITAILFAVILWSYVLSETNPDRQKWIENVPIHYEGMEELNENNYMIVGNLADALGTVNVYVSVKQNEVNSLSIKSVDAYVDLSAINDVGECTVNVDVTNNISGITVLSSSTDTVTLNVDYYESKQIPVEVKTTGSVPDGYYASVPEIAPTTVEIEGARTDIGKVASAVCNIDLTGLTEGFNQNMSIDLLDYDGNVLDKDLFPIDLPSVTVKLDVQHMKTVPIDVESSIVGQDEVASGYEVSDIECTPKTVDIAGDAETLANIDSITLAPYTVSGKTVSESIALDYNPPEGVTVLTTEKAQVYITIREVTKTKTYTDVSLETKNLSSGLDTDFNESKVDVTVAAGVSEMSALDRSDIVPYVDLDGLEAGVYSCDVLFEIPSGFTEENFIASPSTVTVTIY